MTHTRHHRKNFFFFIFNELFTRLKTKQKKTRIHVQYHDMHAYLINNITISLKKVTVFVQLLIALMVCRSGVLVSLIHITI